MVTPIDLDAGQRLLVEARADEIIAHGFDIPEGGGRDQVEGTVALALAARVLQDYRRRELRYDSYGVDTRSLQAQAAGVLMSREIPKKRALWVAELGADLGVAHCRGSGVMKGFPFDGERVLQVLAEHLGSWEGLGSARKRAAKVPAGMDWAADAIRTRPGIAALPEGAKISVAAKWTSDIGSRRIEEPLTIIDVSRCDRDDIVGPQKTPLLHFLTPYLMRGPVAIEGLQPPSTGPFKIRYTAKFPDPRTIGPDFTIKSHLEPITRSATMSDQEMLRLGDCFGEVDVIHGRQGAGYVEHPAFLADGTNSRFVHPGLENECILDLLPANHWMTKFIRVEDRQLRDQPHTDKWWAEHPPAMSMLCYDLPADLEENGTVIFSGRKITERFLKDDPLGDGRHPADIWMRRSPFRYSDGHFSLAGAEQILAPDGCMVYPINAGGEAVFDITLLGYSRKQNLYAAKWFEDVAHKLLEKEGEPYVAKSGSTLIYPYWYWHSVTASQGFRTMRRITMDDRWGLFPNRGFRNQTDPYSTEDGPLRREIEKMFPNPPLETIAATHAWRYGIDLGEG